MIEKLNSARPKLLLCFDGGNSLLKMLYKVLGDRVKHLTLEPEYLALPHESAANLPVDSGMGFPENTAWIRYSKSDDCRLVGRLAKDYRVSVNFKMLKSFSIVPKILAAIGAIAERENLGKIFHLELAILLPLAEISSREELEKELRSALSGFYFRQVWLRVKLERISIVPEASGAAMLDHQRTSYFKNHNCLYPMCGHRNTSLLFFRKGTLSSSESSTTNLGFYDLIDKMRAKVPGLEREEVLLAFSTSLSNYDKEGSGYGNQFTNIDWRRITKSLDFDKAQKELQMLQVACDTSFNEYCRLITNWLEESAPPRVQIDAVVRCGGASELLAPQINSFFQDIPQYVPSEYESPLMEALGFNSADSPQVKEFISLNLPVRFADVWGLFVIFSNYSLSTTSKKEAVV